MIPHSPLAWFGIALMVAGLLALIVVAVVGLVRSSRRDRREQRINEHADRALTLFEKRRARTRAAVLALPPSRLDLRFARLTAGLEQEAAQLPPEEHSS